MSQAVGTEQKLTRLLRHVSGSVGSTLPSPPLTHINVCVRFFHILSVGPDEHCEAVDRVLHVNRQMAKVCDCAGLYEPGLYEPVQPMHPTQFA